VSLQDLAKKVTFTSTTKSTLQNSYTHFGNSEILLSRLECGCSMQHYQCPSRAGYGGPARTATAGRYSEAGLQKSANFVEIQQNVADLPVSKPINQPESRFIF
jgi:hypothetical protein